MTHLPARLALLATLALAACSSNPPTPEWQMTAHSGLDSAAQAWMEGRDRVEAIEFGRARAAVARTGRPALLARAELHRCATRVATLVFEPCTGFDALARDAEPPEQAYARHLQGTATPADTALLPAAQRAAVSSIADPLARLVAAGVRLRRGEATPADIASAIDTASRRGWPRPLLAWLTLQQQRALAAGDRAEADRLQRRIDAVAPGR